MLYCRTESLPLADRRWLEFVAKTSFRHWRPILEYKTVFTSEFPKEVADHICTFSLTDYFEDERGEQTTFGIVAGKRNGETYISLPHGVKEHDVELIKAIHAGVRVAGDSPPAIVPADYDTFMSCARDCHELVQSRFLTAQSAFSLQGGRLITLPREHISHFVTTFRRLRLQDDRATYNNGCIVFEKYFYGTALSRWTTATRKQLNAELNQRVRSGVMGNGPELSFTKSQLLDEVINAQYLHPLTTKRLAKMADYEKEAGGSHLLQWMFLSELQTTALAYIGVILYLEAPFQAAASFHLPQSALRTKHSDLMQSIPENRLSDKDREAFNLAVHELAVDFSTGFEKPADAFLEAQRQLRTKLEAYV